MKFAYFTNLYSPEEFKISCLIKDFIQFLGNKNHNSYLPYQINLHHSHTRFFSHLSIGNQKVEAHYLLEDNPKLDKNQLIAQTIDIADKMIAMGADIDYFGFEGINALMHTSYQHQPTLMKYLLDKGANPNINYFAFEGDTATSSVLDNLCYDENHSDISPSEKEEISRCIALLGKRNYEF